MEFGLGLSGRDDGKRFIVRADELLTAFLELETAIHEFAIWFNRQGQAHIVSTAVCCTK